MIKKLLLILTVITAAGFSSCGVSPLEKHTSVYYEYFDTVTEITCYGEDSEVFEVNCRKAKETMEYYHRLLDIYNEYEGINNLCTVNKNAGGSPVKVDPALVEFLEYGKEMHTLTKGYMNIAFGSVTSIWHEARTDKTYVPAKEALEQAAKYCDINDVIIDKENSTVYLAQKEMSIDAGALGKGYACEKTALVLQGLSDKGYAVNMGGNIRVTGKKTDKDYWTAAIQNPDTSSSNSAVETVYLENYALVTGGSYLRYYLLDGVKYHHIIHPDTLFPENDFLSVSVLCGNSALGDALSTALFNMTLEEGKALAESLEDVYVFWIDKEGNTFYSSGFDKYIKE